MKCLLLCVPLLVSSLTIEQKTSTGSPIEQVLDLLRDMQSKIKEDGKKEEMIYNKYACWCEKTSNRKAVAIDSAEEELRMLGQKILKLKGTIAIRTAEIEKLAADIKANKEAQADATAVRQKENAAYVAETTEMKQALAALQKAVVVLREATKPGASLLQTTAATSAVKSLIQALPSNSALKPDQLSLLESFVSSGSKYSPQSWTIQGTLREMYAEFAKDLQSADTEEAKKNRNFEEFIALKVEKMKDDMKTKARKESERADAEEELSETNQSFDDLKAQMDADVKVFNATKASCIMKHDEWTTRSELRDEELRGIKEALEILGTDDARTLFKETIKPGKETHVDESYETGSDAHETESAESFMQLDSFSSSPVGKAYAALRSRASSVHSLRLGMMAVQVHEAKVGHFDKVIDSIDKMLTTLREEGEADMNKRDQCLDEYQETDSTIANVTWLIEKNEAKIDKLQGLIERRTKEREATLLEIKDVNKTMIDLDTQRKEDNKEFHSEKDNDKKAIKMLVSARAAIQKYYKNHTIEMGPIQGEVKGLELNQKPEEKEDPEFEIDPDQAPDADFTGKGHRKNEAKGVVQILSMVIEDLDDEIKNDMKAEEQAQLAHEAHMAALTDLRKKLTEREINLENTISERKEDKSNEESDKDDNQKDLNSESAYRKQITPDCDWIIGAFHQRAKQRTAEMEGLTQAKDFLAGYDSAKSKPALIEEKQTFDDTEFRKVKFLGLRP